MSMSIGGGYSSSMAQLYAMMGAAQDTDATQDISPTQDVAKGLSAKVKQAQSGGLDKASTVLSLLEELRNSDDPKIAQIGAELKQTDERIGGRFSEAKQDYLLKQMSTLLNIAQGGDGANSGGAGSFHGDI